MAAELIAPRWAAISLAKTPNNNSGVRLTLGRPSEAGLEATTVGDETKDIGARSLAHAVNKASSSKGSGRFSDFITMESGAGEQVEYHAIGIFLSFYGG
jgi:hypothetical protein